MSFISPISARRPPAKKKSSIRNLPDGVMLAITGTWREISSKRCMSRGMPARRAMAMTWMMALVEPPSAMWTRMALSNAAGVKILSGVKSSHTISTARRPLAAHMRGWLASGAGIDDAPGNDRPSASVIAIMVAAVPITMQVPNERAMPPSISFHSSSPMRPARFSSQYFQASEPEPSALPRQLPRSIGPAGT